MREHGVQAPHIRSPVPDQRSGMAEPRWMTALYARACLVDVTSGRSGPAFLNPTPDEGGDPVNNPYVLCKVMTP